MTTLPSQIGPYTVDSELGRGGMGVVYLATDPRLDRKVAIKALPEHFAMNPDRLARFEREARLLASMTHPNIAGVYGLEDQDGARFLVMEYVEGDSLHQHLTRGPLAVDEALRIAAQVASGVEAAHDAGVIHRDLKPGNIVVTRAGVAKVLDFGLAKEIEGRGSSLDLSRSPTATLPHSPQHETAEGQVVGTAAYLSPEQARGKALDKRTDVWAFGCVLFEMLTGESPYAGETATDSLGAILHKDPDWARLPPDVPPTIQLLLRRCLAKDPNRRLRDVGDARVEIEEALRDPTGTSLNLASSALQTQAPTKGSRLRLPIAVALAFLIGAAGVGAALWRSPEPASPVRLEIDRGAEGPRARASAGPEFAISPDGTTIAFVAGVDESTSRLHVRSLDQFEATQLNGTDGAHQPFFSPDGQWIGFFAQNRLRKVSVTGGSPLTLCETEGSERGGSWGDNGTIVFAPSTTDGIYVVSENGGEPRRVSAIDEDARERTHRWPQYLPGSAHAIFISQLRGDSFDDARIEALEVATGKRTVIHNGGMYPRYAASGHLLFGREGTIFAAPFDVKTLTLQGSPTPVLEGVETVSVNGGADIAVSDTGTVLYGAGTDTSFATELFWATMAGEQTSLSDELYRAEAASLSPDGTRVALQIWDSASEYDIWVYEIERQVASRLTFGEREEMNPIWSPDGSQVAYSTVNSEVSGILMRNADGSGEERNVTEATGTADFPVSWSPDGRYIAFMRNGMSTRWDLWTIDVTDPDAEPELYLGTQFEERYPVFSPDGRWIAYVSLESGTPQVYIRAFPAGGGRWQVSIDGGSWPVWAPDGASLYYAWAGALLEVDITSDENSITASRPRELFDHALPHDWFYPQYSVAPEGDRLLLLSDVSRGENEEDQSLSLILNWFTVLKEQTAQRR